MHSNGDLSRYVDLERYPIHQLDSLSGQSLLAECQQMMRRDSLCLLPGFLSEAGRRLLCDEITDLEADAHRVNYRATMYGWMDNSDFPEEHPRSQLLNRRCRVVSTDQLPQKSHCTTLFQQDYLTEFIRRLLGYETLYPSACPTLSIQINVMNESEEFGWHFDTNDGVVSLSIQNADDGGGFEYAPMIRDEENENYAAVEAISNGTETPCQPDNPPGTFSLFLGRRSLHRVAPVGKTQCSRQSLLLSYDRRPGMKFPEETCRRLTSADSTPFFGKC